MRYAIAIEGICLRNEGNDVVVYVMNGCNEWVEVIREVGKFDTQHGTMDHAITALGIEDILR